MNVRTNFAGSPPRALVIGAGVTSNLLHLPVLAKLRTEGALDLAVICDLDDARALAARRKFAFAERSGDAAASLRRPDIDVVYVFASAQMHFGLGLEALRNDKHVFVEKPVAPTAADAGAMADLAKASGLIAAGGHNRRYYASLDELRRRLGNSRPRYIEAIFHKPELGRPPPFGARSWLSANGIHALDAIVFLMGGLPETIATQRRGESFSALMHWPDDAQGVFLCNNEAGERREEYRIHIPGTTFTIDEHGLTMETGGKIARLGFPPSGDGFNAEHRAFIAAVRTGAELRHGIASLAPSLFLAERIEDGYSGRVVLRNARAAVSAQARAREVLVDRVATFGSALAQLPPDIACISVADVSGSDKSRPDVVGALLGAGAPPLEPYVLDKLPNLKVVGVAGLSLARYGAASLLARGITVVNASNAYAQSVAEFALALIILARRRAFESHEIMRRGGWGIQAPSPVARARALGLPIARALNFERPLRALWRHSLGATAGGNQAGSRMLHGATVGLIGWGANAQALHRLLGTLGAQVIVYSEHASDDELAGVTRATLADVLSAEIVSLHRGLTPATRHFLGEAELAQLRPGAVLINVARGELINPAALQKRLERGDIFACLDTFEAEPLPPNDRLRHLPNVFLTSHIAGGSRQMQAEAAVEVVSKVLRVLDGARVATVTEKRLAAMT